MRYPDRRRRASYPRRDPKSIATGCYSPIAFDLPALAIADPSQPLADRIVLYPENIRSD